MATVSGFIRNETGGPALNATVRAFDKDLRHEQLLGKVVIAETTGHYEITYTPDQFRRSEKKSADLIVRAFDRQGNLRAESELRFNAQETERIDLTFGPLIVPERPRLSELEQLRESIEPVREGVAYGGFTVSELTFLTEESIRAGSLGVLERRIVRERLEFLRLADQFARRTGVPLEAFYGWFRQDQPQVLDELLDVPSRVLRAALVTAIRERIIPDITTRIPEVLERIRALLVAEGRLVRRRWVVQLVNAVTSQPLAGYAVAVVDASAEPDEQDLGTLFTDGKGTCAIVLSWPGNASENTANRLQLTILDDEVAVAETSVTVRPNQQEVDVLRVEIRDAEDGNESIEGATSAPPRLVGRLRQRGITTLRDLLAQPEVTDDDDPEELELLRANAKFAVLAPELGDTERGTLVASGFRSVLDVGAASRAEFVRNHHEALGGDGAAYATHFAARDASNVFWHMVGSAWLKNVTTPDDEPDPEVPTGVNDVLSGLRRCGCKDCTSAVSPAAYLAHLLEWTLAHIKDGTASIAFTQLADEFHQPFGDLPASCAAVETQLRQVRICVEALWRFTGFLDRADLQMPTPFRTAYRQLRNQLYRAILTNLGTSFEQLRRATLHIQGDSMAAEQVASQRRGLADLLGINEAHLNELFFNIEQPPISPSEDELQQRFGFKSTRAANVFASPGAPADLIAWQRERLEANWQEQDWPADSYAGENRLPFVDPDLIDNTYLRTPLAENPAFTLIDARQAVLAEHRQSLVNQQPQQNGLPALLEGELGQGINQLRSLYETLQSDDPEADAIVQAHETIAFLNLTPAGFTHLMRIDAQLEAGEPIGSTPEEIDVAWEAVFDIFSRAHRHTLFAGWVEEENNLALVLGPRLFWMPFEATPANPWRATMSERFDWEEALDRRSSRPIIDPDQIQANHIIVFGVLSQPEGQELGFAASLHTPPLQAMTLWQQRREWIDTRLDVLQTARQNQDNALETLQAALQSSTLGIDLSLLEQLATLEAEGRNLESRLAQLNLTPAGFRFLAGIRELALGNLSVPNPSWQEVDAILVQAEKRREFAAWRLAEQANGITLHPHRFVVPNVAEEQDDAPQTRWLHAPLALQQWLDTLSARGDQLKALTAGLSEAVGKAEESVLPLLRNILIMQTLSPGDSLAEKSEWMDRRLLIDMRLSGCQMTTRVSQAIETLQRFIRGVYSQEHLDEMQHLTLDAIEDYESEWPVMGAYASWRAFMLAYLYPENLLHVTPHPRPSFGFTEYIKDSRPGRVSPEDACTAAKNYSDYFRDVCSLKVQATCQIKTFVARSGSCTPTGTATPSLLHLFARAQTSGKVYVARLDPSREFTDTTTNWEPVAKLGLIEQIFGATPHFTPSGSRFVLLFFSVRTLGKMELRFARYDVDKLSWSDDIHLGLPPEADDGFSAAVIQKRGASPNFQSGDFGFPTLLTVKPKNGPIYLNQLNQEAGSWEAATWKPFFGPRMIDSFGEVLSLIQRTSNEYLIVAEGTGAEEGVRYRFLYLTGQGRDDLTWKRIGFSEGYNGGLAWFNDTATFLFYTDAGRTVYQRLGAAGPLKTDSNFTYHQAIQVDQSLGLDAQLRDQARQMAADIIRFNDEWLEKYVGISLSDFKLSNFRPNFFVPHNNEEDEIDPLNPDRENIQETEDPVFFAGVSLNLLEVFSYELQGTDITIPDDARFRYDSLDLEFYQIQLQHQYVQEFLKHIANIDSAKILEEDLGLWKFADEQIKRFSVEGLSLAALISRFVANITQVYLPHYAGGAYISSSTSFRERDTDDERNDARTISNTSLVFLPTSGDERAGVIPRKAVAIQNNSIQATSNGQVWTRLRRLGNVLDHGKLRRLSPHGSGPFDIMPRRDINELKQRRLEIKSMYTLHLGAPASVRRYLKEAYNLVPIHLGHELQRSGHYEEALLWFRQVYDYLQSGAFRKIDYSLTVEQNLALNYDEAEEWLADVSNAHAIAATRRNTYTRHILQLIIRCLIEYANSLFSRDNVSDNVRARELYSLALRLLELRVLRPGFSRCRNIIGQLEIDVVESSLQLQQFIMVLTQITAPDQLDSVVASLRRINQDTARPAIDRLAEMRQTVVTAVSAIPPPPRMSDVLDAKRRTVATIENQFMVLHDRRILLKEIQQRSRQTTIARLAEVTDLSPELSEPLPQLPWLREARPDEGDEPEAVVASLALSDLNALSRLTVLSQIRQDLPMASLTAAHSGGFTTNTGISFDFCIPQNPVVQALRTRAQNNLTKLRTCRNIAGFVRQLDPYGAPIGFGSGLVSPDGTIFSGIVDAPPTAYRYAALIGRTKELVSISQQIEGSYQAALENAENAALSVLQAAQNVELAQTRVSLQDLRVTQANNELGLSHLQKSGAVLREETYAGWIAGGKNEHEERMLKAYSDASEAQKQAARARAAASIAQTTASIAGAWSLRNATDFVTGVAAAQTTALLASIASTLAEATFQERAINAQATAQAASFEASFERTNDQWQLQEGLAALDVQIGNQQIVLAQNQIDIVQQERVIAGIEQTHAVDVLNFLLGKNFTEEMYRWIASVLEDVYRFFLQEATAVARLAERQLAFERQQAPLKVIQADYWNAPAEPSSSTSRGSSIDRLGLTGSARLLRDIFQLDNYAFETRRRKQALTITLDLAEMFPVEFQRFRETGVLIFNTSLAQIDRQFPGYYLCLIQQVNISVVALIPPTRGIRATCTSAGISRAVVGGDTFQTVTIRNLPERIAMTSASTASGVMDLEADSQSLLNPFEGTGFDTLWELRMPRAANPFDYNSMATVLFTVNMTALHSFDYEREVIQRLDRRVSFDRAFDFRQVFSDPWYDLNNPDQTETPMAVRFNTRRSDFPTNLTNLAIQHVVLYLVRRDGEVFEQPLRYLHFTTEGSQGAAGGPASTVDGRVSTRSGNGVNWLSLIGQSPYGAWELAFPDNPPADTEARGRFTSELIENLLLVITVSGQTPPYPS